jgi:hypothetical protein
MSMAPLSFSKELRRGRLADAFRRAGGVHGYFTPHSIAGEAEQVRRGLVECTRAER